MFGLAGFKAGIGSGTDAADSHPLTMFSPASRLMDSSNSVLIMSAPSVLLASSRCSAVPSSKVLANWSAWSALLSSSSSAAIRPLARPSDTACSNASAALRSSAKSAFFSDSDASTAAALSTPTVASTVASPPLTVGCGKDTLRVNPDPDPDPDPDQLRAHPFGASAVSLGSKADKALAPSCAATASGYLAAHSAASISSSRTRAVSPSLAPTVSSSSVLSRRRCSTSRVNARFISSSWGLVSLCHDS